MNERIKELAIQAGFLHRPFGPTVQTRYTKKKEEQLEKFAELIMEECANILTTNNQFHDVKPLMRYAAIVLKKHFGVRYDD